MAHVVPVLAVPVFLSALLDLLSTIIKELGKHLVEGLLRPQLTWPLKVVCLVALPFALTASVFAFDLHRQRFVAVVPGGNVFNLVWTEDGEVELVVTENGRTWKRALSGEPRVVYLGDGYSLHRWLGHEPVQVWEGRRKALAQHLVEVASVDGVASIDGEAAARLAEVLDPREGEPRVLDTGRLLRGDAVRVSLRCRRGKRPLLADHEEAVWTVTKAREEGKVKVLWLETDHALGSCEPEGAAAR